MTIKVSTPLADWLKEKRWMQLQLSDGNLLEQPHRSRTIVQTRLQKIRTEHPGIGTRDRRLWNACWVLADGVHAELFPKE